MLLQAAEQVIEVCSLGIIEAAWLDACLKEMIEDIARQLGSFGASYASFARVASGKKFEGRCLPKDITSGKQQDSCPSSPWQNSEGARAWRSQRATSEFCHGLLEPA